MPGAAHIAFTSTKRSGCIGPFGSGSLEAAPIALRSGRIPAVRIHRDQAVSVVLESIRQAVVVDIGHGSAENDGAPREAIIAPIGRLNG